MELLSYMEAAGLEAVPTVALSMNSCGNLMPAFKFARNAIESEGLQNIAIVSTDCAYERTRVAHMQLGILSDGAASCIVSGESDEAQFEILGEGQATNQKVLHLTWPDQKAAGLQFVVNGVRKAVEKAYHDAMLTRNDVDFLFCPNIRSDSNEFLSRFLRIERKRSYHEGLATYSHVYSSDCLINLVHSKLWRSKNSQNDGQTLLCLMMGSHSWGAMILRSK
jgi:3-oxoacyl-[acyl-carrier-protein] synthase III